MLQEVLVADVLTPEQRKLNMSRIRGKDTKPELLIRRGLHARGFRYKLHDRKLPGRPDLVFPRYGAILFIHGCFWHGHNCPLFKTPATRQEFWTEKIDGNRARDKKNAAALLKLGWRVVIVWECSLRGPSKINGTEVIQQCHDFLLSKNLVFTEISGAKSLHEQKRKT